MNRLHPKILLLLIAFLLVSNLILLVLVMKRPEPPRRTDRSKMMQEFLEKEIGFSAIQLAQYDSLRNAHMQRNKPRFDSISRLKTTYFDRIRLDADSMEEVRLQQQMTELQAAMDQQLLTHLREVRTLCTPQQQPVFDSLLYKVTRRIAGPWNRGRDSSGR
ncbi:MAG TPA: hypothetical protein PKE63_01390 [Lacibacter sp.]|nr:hypothetical protein [Lacibacter sp.]